MGAGPGAPLGTPGPRGAFFLGKAATAAASTLLTAFTPHPTRPPPFPLPLILHTASFRANCGTQARCLENVQKGSFNFCEERGRLAALPVAVDCGAEEERTEEERAGQTLPRRRRARDEEGDNARGRTRGDGLGGGSRKLVT